MFYKIKNVQPLPNMILHVEFANGDNKRYDVKPLMDKWEVFKDLNRNELFNLVRVDTGGYGVVWNDYIDLACNELWENGLIWDSDFTKLTNAERESMELGDQQIIQGKTVLVIFPTSPE